MTGTVVAQASEAAVEGNNGIVADDLTFTGDVYVLFGFGKRCSMIGKVTQEAPIRFGEKIETNAANTYRRLGLIYRIARGNGAATPPALDRAVFVGAVNLHEDGIASGGSRIEEYLNLTKSQ